MNSRIRMTTLDQMWAKAVKLRAGGKCERCGAVPKPHGLHAAHVFTRSHYLTRWDSAGGVALCYGCHSWGHKRPQLFLNWAKEKLGDEQFTRLLVRSRMYNAKVDRGLVLLALREEVKRLEPH